MRAISLTRPWPFSFINGPVEHQKRVENRSWKPWPEIVGQRIALHAAQSWDEEDREFIAERMGIYVPGKKEQPHGEIFAVCRLVGFVTSVDDPRLKPDQKKWFFGPFGWLLENMLALARPVPCKGAQGLWNVPDNVLKQILAQIDGSEIPIGAEQVSPSAQGRLF